MQRIDGGDDPWLALGDFLDDWRRSAPSKRPRLVASPLPPVSEPNIRWAALIAAAVE
jgi:hypothetical protein